MFKLGKSASLVARLKSNSRVDHKRKISFTFDGTSYSGYAVTHWHLPCWQMACILLAARSNITGRAASYQSVQKNQMR